jgi:hypothetical protein
MQSMLGRADTRLLGTIARPLAYASPDFFDASQFVCAHKTISAAFETTV